MSTDIPDDFWKWAKQESNFLHKELAQFEQGSSITHLLGGQPIDCTAETKQNRESRVKELDALLAKYRTYSL